MSFESINDDYCRARGAATNVELIIMKRNHYINATKLCAHAGKRISKWVQYNHDLIEEYTNNLETEAKIVITTGPREFHGTYFHPEIIPHIALWISPQHLIAVNNIINEYNIFKEQQEYAHLPWYEKMLIKFYVMFQ